MQTHAVFTREAPSHLEPRTGTSSRIEEIIEAHILQVSEVADPASADELELGEDRQDIYEVFAAEKKRHETKTAKFSEFTTQPTTDRKDTSTNNPHAMPQYHYQASAEDHRLVSELSDYLMKGQLSLTTPAHVLAASPSIRKDLVDKLKVRHVETNEFEEARYREPQIHDTASSLAAQTPSVPSWFCSHSQGFSTATQHVDTPPTHLAMCWGASNRRMPEYCLPLQELEILVDNSFPTPGIYNTGSQIVVIRLDLVQALGAHINTH
jgi:hypothetical protein